MVLFYLYVTFSCRLFRSFLLEHNDIHLIGYHNMIQYSRHLIIPKSSEISITFCQQILNIFYKINNSLPTDPLYEIATTLPKRLTIQLHLQSIFFKR